MRRKYDYGEAKQSLSQCSPLVEENLLGIIDLIGDSGAGVAERTISDVNSDCRSSFLIPDFAIWMLSSLSASLSRVTASSYGNGAVAPDYHSASF